MLHRSNAESALWKEGDSPGEAAGQLWKGCGGPDSAGTWPGAVFGGAWGRAEGREDLLGSLRSAWYPDGATVAAAAAELPPGPAPQAPGQPKGAVRLPWRLAPLQEMDSRHADATAQHNRPRPQLQPFAKQTHPGINLS